MKQLPFAVVVLTAAAFVAGCNSFGPNPSPPTPTEQTYFNIETNLVQQVQARTNTVTITNTVVTTQTNGVVVTNFVPVQVPQVTQVTSTVPVYTLTPNSNAQTAAETIGSVTNTFAPGVGTLVGYGLLALLGVWGHLRSYKRGQTAATQTATSNALTQEMETILEFIKALPNGQQYASALTGWLQQHQLDTGTLQQVVNILKSQVSNPNAKAAASEVIATLNSLTPLATKVAQPTA